LEVRRVLLPTSNRRGREQQPLDGVATVHRPERSQRRRASQGASAGEGKEGGGRRGRRGEEDGRGDLGVFVEVGVVTERREGRGEGKNKRQKREEGRKWMKQKRSEKRTEERRKRRRDVHGWVGRILSSVPHNITELRGRRGLRRRRGEEGEYQAL